MSSLSALFSSNRCFVSPGWECWHNEITHEPTCHTSEHDPSCPEVDLPPDSAKQEQGEGRIRERLLGAIIMIIGSLLVAV